MLVLILRRYAECREVRDAILHAHISGDIDDKEFIILNHLYKSDNLEFQYWKYDRFQLHNMTDDKCWSDFRFCKQDIPRLRRALRIPEFITTYNRLRVDGNEALCVFLNPIRIKGGQILPPLLVFPSLLPQKLFSHADCS